MDVLIDFTVLSDHFCQVLGFDDTVHAFEKMLLLFINGINHII